MQCSHELLGPPLSRDDDNDGEGSAPGGRSLSMPLSLDMKENRVMSAGRRSLRDSPNSRSSCS